MCAQEVMNIEEQCAEHFLLQNDRSADQIQNTFGLRGKAATEQIQNFCHGA